MKIAILGVVAGSALLLAGCSGAPEGDPTGAPAAPTDAATADASTSTPQPTVGNLDDPLCAAAQANIDDSTALEAKTGDLTTMMQDPAFLTSDDATTLNAWGDDMLVLTASGKAFYDLGVAETQGEDVNADFVMLSSFVDQYSSALAQAAADAESPTAFVTSIQTLFGSPEMQQVAQDAPAAAENVHDYLVTRCGITD